MLIVGGKPRLEDFALFLSLSGGKDGRAPGLVLFCVLGEALEDSLGQAAFVEGLD